jgi:hypothetical protein
MKKIYFDDTTFIWKTKLNFLEYKNDMLNEWLKIEEKNQYNPKNDNYNYEFTKNKNKLDDIVNLSIDKCKELYTKKFNNVLLGSWVNVIRAKEPKQPGLSEGIVKMHQHDIISKIHGFFIPDYTFVYYIQMPDNLINDDGVLFIEGENKKMFNILPEEDDLIIMVGDLPHGPNVALNSTKDRIVLAGNIGFEYNKGNKTLL